MSSVPNNNFLSILRASSEADAESIHTSTPHDASVGQGVPGPSAVTGAPVPPAATDGHGGGVPVPPAASDVQGGGGRVPVPPAATDGQGGGVPSLGPIAVGAGHGGGIPGSTAASDGQGEGGTPPPGPTAVGGVGQGGGVPGPTTAADGQGVGPNAHGASINAPPVGQGVDANPRPASSENPPAGRRGGHTGAGTSLSYGASSNAPPFGQGVDANPRPASSENPPAGRHGGHTGAGTSSPSYGANNLGFDAETQIFQGGATNKHGPYVKDQSRHGQGTHSSTINMSSSFAMPPAVGQRGVTNDGSYRYVAGQSRQGQGQGQDTHGTINTSSSFAVPPHVGQRGATNDGSYRYVGQGQSQGTHGTINMSSSFATSPPVRQFEARSVHQHHSGSSFATSPPVRQFEARSVHQHHSGYEEEDDISALPDNETVYTVSGRSRARAKHTKDASWAGNWLPFMKKECRVDIADPNIFQIGSDDLCRMSLMPDASLITLIDNYSENKKEKQEKIKSQQQKVTKYQDEIKSKNDEVLSVDIEMTNIIHQIETLQHSLKDLSSKKELATKKVHETERSYQKQSDILKQLQQGLDMMSMEYHTAKLLTREGGFHPYRSIPSAAILVAHDLTTQEQWEAKTLPGLELFAGPCLELGYSESSEWQRNPFNVRPGPFRIHQARRSQGRRETVDEFRRYLQGVFNFNKNFGVPDQQPAAAPLQVQRAAPAPAPATTPTQQKLPDASTEDEMLGLLEEESEEQIDLVLMACDDKSVYPDIPRHLFRVVLYLSCLSHQEREVFCGFAKACRKRHFDESPQSDSSYTERDHKKTRR